MITRTWHGVVPKSKGKAFKKYLEETGIGDARLVKGNLAAYVHVVEQKEYTHFFLCTIWSSWDDILAYAGNASNIAVIYPEDDAYGLISDPIVIHQEVNSQENPFERVFTQA